MRVLASLIEAFSEDELGRALKIREKILDGQAALCEDSHSY